MAQPELTDVQRDVWLDCNLLYTRDVILRAVDSGLHRHTNTIKFNLPTSILRELRAIRCLAGLQLTVHSRCDPTSSRLWTTQAHQHNKVQSANINLARVESYQMSGWTATYCTLEM
ncbi:hypothetical protein J6590_080802 [Homalodisca vitripennis]|nr:hypothetical protein J6590_080802 [Homalodisca vitripennis]